MTFSHWATTIIEEKHAAAMRWVTTTLAEPDSKVTLARLMESDVLAPQVAVVLAHELHASFAPGTSYSELHLPLEQISNHLLAAFEKTYAYLISPELFLTDFLAGPEGTTLDDTFANKLNIFGAYDYFSMILSAWSQPMRVQGSAFVSRTELAVKLHEIDDLILRHATISVMVDLLDPLFDFHRHRSGDPRIVGSELALFFEDKGFMRAVHEFNARAQQEFTLRETVEIISVLLGTGYAVAEPPAAIKVPARAEYPQTQYDEFMHDLHEAGVNVRPPESTEAAALPRMEDFISKKLRQRTLRDIFHGNRGEYVRFVSTLNASTSLENALLNLETTLRLQREKETSKAAQRLRDAIVLRFYQVKP